MNVSRLVRTARHLTAGQFLYWPLRRLQGARPVRPPASNATLAPRHERERLASVLVAHGPRDPAAVVTNARRVLDGEFVFLNHAERLAPVDWTVRHVSHLWSYNLQYFDYAVDLAWAARLTNDDAFARGFSSLASTWMDACGDGRGDGWEPYALSTRALNWLRALLLLDGRLDGDTTARAASSVGAQLTYLERRLERHLLGNHLQRNVQALAFGGLALRGGRAAAWRRSRLAEAWGQVDGQLTRDGVHVERSPMYHALALVDWLELADLARAAGVDAPPRVLRRLTAATAALGALARDDGTLHRFNDCADGIAPPRAWIDALARRVVGVGVPRLRGADARADAGYFAWAGTDGRERFVADCGPLGPDYQPAHGHCDTLSFELDLAGRPVIVDAGTSGYAGDPLRAYQRSTRAHNTVSVADREQSEVWGVFRVGGRATASRGRLDAAGDSVRFEGACRAYGGVRPVHERRVEREADAWRVTDVVTGADGLAVASYVHLHPDFHVTTEGDALIARAEDLAVRITPFGVDEVVIARGETSPPLGWYAREFGRAVPTSTVVMRRSAHDGTPFGYTVAPT